MTLAAAAVVLGAGAALWAQEEGEDGQSAPPPDPQLRDESVQERGRRLRDDMAEKPTESRPIASPRIGGVEPGALAGPEGTLLRRGKLIPDGVFVSNRSGEAVRVSSGEWVFVFRTTEADEKRRRAVVLLPNARLERVIRRADRAEADRAPMTITGRVFAYRGINYLLMTAPPKYDAPRPAEAGDETTPAAETDADVAAEATEGAGGEPRTADQLLRDMEAAIATSGARRPTIIPELGSRQRESAASALAFRDGVFITGRRGRVVRGAGGELWFVFDEDTDGDSVSPPMPLLPNAQLGRLESIVQRTGDDAAFSVSGVVTTFDRRNFLLAQMAIVEQRTGGVNPLQ